MSACLFSFAEKTDTFERRSLSVDVIDFVMLYRSKMSATEFANVKQWTKFQ